MSDAAVVAPAQSQPVEGEIIVPKTERMTKHRWNEARKSAMDPAKEDLLYGLIDQYRGRIAIIARALKLSERTVRGYIAQSPSLKELLAEVREQEKDLCEMHLQKAIAKGRVDAQIFYLKTQGRDRGYAETVDVNQNVRKEVTVTVDWSKLDSDALRKAEEAFRQIGVIGGSGKSGT